MNVLKLMKIINTKLPPYIWAWISKYKNYEEQSGSGTLVFENTYGQKFSKFDAEGQTEQESTEGRQLFNTRAWKDNNFTITRGTLVSKDENSITVISTESDCYTSTYDSPLFNMEVEANTEYIFSMNKKNNTTGYNYIFYYDENNSQIGMKYTTNTTYTFTTPANTKYIRVRLGIESAGLTETFYNMFIRKSTETDNTWEPYTGGIPGPNPSYPFPINNVTGENEIIVENGNLFNESLLNAYNNYENGKWIFTTDAYSGSILTGQVGGLSNRYVPSLIKLSPNENYTLKFFNISENGTGYTGKQFINYAFFDNGGHIIRNQVNGEGFFNFQAPNQECYLDIRKTGNKGTISFSNVMLIRGTYTEETFPEYVPYQTPQTVTFPLEEGQYMAKGDYLANNGIHHVMGKVVFDGSSDERWAYISSYNRFQVLVDDFISPGVTTVANIICNKLITTTKVQIAFENNKISGAEANEHRIMIRIDNTITTFEELRTWLSNNPITVQYELSQEVIEPYTQAQQEAYNEIQKLMSYKGVTHISQENDNLPFNLKVVYRKDLEMILTSLDNRIKELENEGE